MIGLNLKLATIGYVAKEFPRLDARNKRDLHAVKSKAGKVFRAENVESVCVFDENGIARLYLKKTPQGVHREER